jgi:hypothetical protein
LDEQFNLRRSESARFRPIITRGKYWTIYSFLTSTPKCINLPVGSHIMDLLYSLSGSKQCLKQLLKYFVRYSDSIWYTHWASRLINPLKPSGYYMYHTL